MTLCQEVDDPNLVDRKDKTRSLVSQCRFHRYYASALVVRTIEIDLDPGSA